MINVNMCKKFNFSVLNKKIHNNFNLNIIVNQVHRFIKLYC